jgi:hypothetical protein
MRVVPGQPVRPLLVLPSIRASRDAPACGGLIGPNMVPHGLRVLHDTCVYLHTMRMRACWTPGTS